MAQGAGGYSESSVRQALRGAEDAITRARRYAEDGRFRMAAEEAKEARRKAAEVAEVLLLLQERKENWQEGRGYRTDHLRGGEE